MNSRALAYAFPALALGLSACSGAPHQSLSGSADASETVHTDDGTAQAGSHAVNISDTNGEHKASPLNVAPFTISEVASFDEPWAMTFLAITNQALITERGGALKLWTNGQAVRDVAGVPAVAYAGQGGLGDVIVSPDFSASGLIYLSWAESGPNKLAGAVVAQAKLVQGPSPKLEDVTIIWRQTPKVSGGGHFSHRLTFSPDGQYLFIGSGDRQKFDPAQDMNSNLGKILRIRPDGSLPADNPFAKQGGVAAQIWSLGHRNILGLSFDGAGLLWNQEMGPKGGDEVNLVTPSANYGYPIVSNGDHYDGRDIPDHDTRPEFAAPKLWWNPSVSPSGLAYYGGDLFKGWKNSLLMGALSGQGLIRMSISGDQVSKAERWDLGLRIREVEVGSDGSVWLLSDGDDGKLLKLEPKSS